MNTPEDPRIWQGLRAHLDELGSAATVPPVRRIMEKPRSDRLPRVVTGLVRVGVLVLAVGFLLPGLLAVRAPITGATPAPSPVPVTAALPTAAEVIWAELIGHTYVATDVTESGRPIGVVADTRIWLNFGDASQFGASGGCNAMGGEYEIRDGRLIVANVSLTFIGCPGELGQQEGKFIMLLQSSPTISRDTTGLVLSTGDLVIKFADEAST